MFAIPIYVNILFQTQFKLNMVMKVFKHFHFFFTCFSIHKEISNRALELKYLVDNCFIDTIGETHKNNQTLKDLQNKNNYYIEITKSVLNHNNLADILNVSRYVIFKLNT